jgi:3-isopropylmalate dehydratase small subunit
MPFQPFHTLTSRIVPLRIDHIDTDRIIPARFLTSVESSGYEKFLFHDWRFHPDGSPNASFILNQPKGQGKILLAGRNFGCGSSREHAAWALFQYGFRVVISSDLLIFSELTPSTSGCCQSKSKIRSLIRSSRQPLRHHKSNGLLTF